MSSWIPRLALTCPWFEKLGMPADPVQAHDSFEPDKDHNQIVSEMTLFEAGPVDASFSERMFVVMGR